MAKKYIVVGAGWFGIRAVKAIEALSTDSEITVVQIGSKDYIDINIANPRLASDPDTIDTTYQPLTKAWSRAKLLNVNEVKSISSGSVVVVESSGEEKTLEADGIVVATGSVQSSPLMKDSVGSGKEERKAQFVAFRDAVKASQAGVLIVGGGATGVELAGEVATDFPSAKVTLINKPDLLMNGSSKRASISKCIAKQLTKLGVTVITGDYIEGLREDFMGEAKKFTTSKGVEIEADVAIVCVGGKPNVPYAPEDALDEKTKGLVVNADMLCEKLGSDASKPVWAVGDCTMYGGRGMFADPQTAALKASVSHFEKTGSATGGPMKYKHKESEKLPSLVSVGRKGGAFTLPFVNSTMGKALKAKDLGVSFMYKKEYGVKV